jgi:hypothetical protein
MAMELIFHQKESLPGGTSKAGLKSVNDLDKLDEHFEIAEKYTEGPGSAGCQCEA